MAGECTAVPCDLDVSGNLGQSSRAPPIQSNTEYSHEQLEQLVSGKSAPVPGDPNLDPFYLERSLEDSKSWECHAADDTDVELEDVEIEYFMSYMTEDKPQLPDDPVEIPCSSHQSQSVRAPIYTTPPHWQRTALHYSQSSCSSIRTDATGVTPDLTPSSSFSSTSSVPNCPEAVRKATEQLAFHSDRIRRERSGSAARFYLPAATPPTQSRACTRPSTPVERTGTATLHFELNNLSSETLTMIPKDPPAPAASSMRSKPLPSLPPLTRNPSGPAPQRKCHSPGPRAPIELSLISPPSLINPVTMEPHASHFDHALFIPAHDCPSPVPHPALPSPPISRQITSGSSRGRASTSTSVAHGEQSVWESDSDSESITAKSHSRRGPIETLRKVRSRVQLRRIAKSEGKLRADTPDTRAGQHDTLPTSFPHPYAEARAAASVTSIPDALPMPMPNKQTLRLVAPSMTSLPRPDSRYSNEKGMYEFNTSTAAAIQAQSRRRQRSNAGESLLSLKQEMTYDRYYCQRRDLHYSDPDPGPGPSSTRPSVFKRVWGSLRALNCRSDR
jgi:hypothetical protein